MNKIIVKEELENDSVLIFKLSDQISEVFVFSNAEFPTISEPVREGVLYAGPASGHEAPDEIRRLVDPFYNIRGITDILIDGDEIWFFRDREADPYDATQDVIDCIIDVMRWRKDETKVVHELNSLFALFHDKGVKPPKGKDWLP